MVPNPEDRRQRLMDKIVALGVINIILFDRHEEATNQAHYFYDARYGAMPVWIHIFLQQSAGDVAWVVRGNNTIMRIEVVTDMFFKVETDVLGNNL